MKIWLEPCGRERWSEFAAYHYAPDEPVSPTFTECFIAKAEIADQTREIGFAAAIRCPVTVGSGPDKRTDANSWRSHKVVVKLSDSSPNKVTMWGKVADALAQHYLDMGMRYYGHAPLKWSTYPDVPSSGWIHTSVTARRRNQGIGAHEYIGVKPDLRDSADGRYPRRLG